MKAITTRTWSTPLIMGCSLVVAGSGVMMFYHLGEGLVKSMHEWLGLLFVAAIILHVLNHWLPVSRYLKTTQALVIMAAVVMLAAGWILTNGNNSEHPAKRLLAKVQRAPLVLVAELQGQSGDDLVNRLRSAGFVVASPQQTLNDIATKNERSPMELISIVMADNAEQ